MAIRARCQRDGKPNPRSYSASLVVLHVDEGGFCLLKEYFKMTVPQDLKPWSICETIISATHFGSP